MPIMKVRGIGSKGVVKDLPAFELAPEVWSDCLLYTSDAADD